MRHLALLVLLIAKNVLSESTTEEMEYSEGTSVEARYFLPPVNVSVDDTGGNVSKTTLTVRSSLSRVLDFYNTELLAASWDRMKGNLTEGCQNDVETYIVGLGKAENWALKSKYYIFSWLMVTGDFLIKILLYRVAHSQRLNG